MSRVSERRCQNTACAGVFKTTRAARRFCSDRCCAESYVRDRGHLVGKRPRHPVTEEVAIARRVRQLESIRRCCRRLRSKPAPDARPVREPPARTPLQARPTLPGEIAYAVLYGEPRPMSRGVATQVRARRYVGDVGGLT